MSANSSTALTSMMKRFSMSLLLILIFNISCAKAFESGNPTESSEPEIRAALCDLEKRDFVNAQKRIEAILKFVKARRGGRGVITNVENIERALRGETGTWIEG